MNLTPKQEKFCLAYLETGNASDAYRQAYDADGMTAKTITEESCRILKTPKISARVGELRDKLEAECLWSRQQSVTTLARIAGSEKESATARIAAVKELNAMHGYNVPTSSQTPFLGADGQPVAVTINTVYVAAGGRDPG